MASRSVVEPYNDNCHYRLHNGEETKMDDKAREILETAKSEGVQFIDLQFTDILGTTKSVTIPYTELDEA